MKTFRSIAAIILSTLMSVESVQALPYGSPGANAFPINIPSSLGYVSETYVSHAGATTPDVILIQNLHVNRSVQFAISGILKRLKTQGLMPDHIAIEGATGPVDIGFMQRYPNPVIRKKAADYLVQQGEMPGVMHFAVSEGEGGLFGIETDEYYQANLEMFQRSYKERAALRQEIEKIQAVLPKLKKDRTSRENVQILEKDVAAVSQLINNQVIPDELPATLRQATEAIDHLKLVLPPDTAAQLIEPLSASVNFYALALLRNDELLKNALAVRELGHQTTSIIVTGGFHTAALADGFKKRGLSYAIITPNIKRADKVDENLYVERLLDHHLTPQQIETGEDWASLGVMAGPVTANKLEVLYKLWNGAWEAATRIPRTFGWSGVQKTVAAVAVVAACGALNSSCGGNTTSGPAATGPLATPGYTIITTGGQGPNTTPDGQAHSSFLNHTISIQPGARVEYIFPSYQAGINIFPRLTPLSDLPQAALNSAGVNFTAMPIQSVSVDGVVEGIVQFTAQPGQFNGLEQPPWPLTGQFAALSGAVAFTVPLGQTADKQASLSAVAIGNESLTQNQLPVLPFFSLQWFDHLGNAVIRTVSPEVLSAQGQTPASAAKTLRAQAPSQTPAPAQAASQLITNKFTVVANEAGGYIIDATARGVVTATYKLAGFDRFRVIIPASLAPVGSKVEINFARSARRSNIVEAIIPTDGILELSRMEFMKEGTEEIKGKEVPSTFSQSDIDNKVSDIIIKLPGTAKKGQKINSIRFEGIAGARRGAEARPVSPLEANLIPLQNRVNRIQGQMVSARGATRRTLTGQLREAQRNLDVATRQAKQTRPEMSVPVRVAYTPAAGQLLHTEEVTREIASGPSETSDRTIKGRLNHQARIRGPFKIRPGMPIRITFPVSQVDTIVRVQFLPKGFKGARADSAGMMLRSYTIRDDGYGNGVVEFKIPEEFGLHADSFYLQDLARTEWIIVHSGEVDSNGGKLNPTAVDKDADFTEIEEIVKSSKPKAAISESPSPRADARPGLSDATTHPATTLWSSIGLGMVFGLFRRRSGQTGTGVADHSTRSDKGIHPPLRSPLPQSISHDVPAPNFPVFNLGASIKSNPEPGRHGSELQYRGDFKPGRTILPTILLTAGLAFFGSNLLPWVGMAAEPGVLLTNLTFGGAGTVAWNTVALVFNWIVSLLNTIKVHAETLAHLQSVLPHVNFHPAQFAATAFIALAAVALYKILDREVRRRTENEAGIMGHLAELASA